MATIDYESKIPNNVDLKSDKRLQRALEAWQPNFLNWWGDMGPEGFQQDDVFLRTAISVTSEGWANFGYVKMPEYRWGIFLADPVAERKIGFGDAMGEPVWQLPMFPEYDEQIKSEVADIKNVGEGRWGGAITAAKFLERFVGSIPWTHIDIAGPAFADQDLNDWPQGATGAGVLTLLRWLENL